MMSDSWFPRLNSMARDPALEITERFDALIDEYFLVFSNPESSAFAFEVLTLAESEPFAARIVFDLEQRYTQLIATMVEQMNHTLSQGERWLRASLIVAHAGGLLVFCRLSNKTEAEMVNLKHSTRELWSALCLAPR
ncbi:hypothetical protein [Paraburkholderia sp. CNPSo 3281]|uniref:hypothetical protein n=1 Tax=Paraburkholderia sp. CNPSo 3281 TaxID=2940933 RepID=UPI0020B861D0|nr:hypothetical protein [Paraburkholderia sp. CNPSo 3281]MCP3720616.1 hypothetical protein [Paraburkholderia sp. CNPSo 3281]